MYQKMQDHNNKSDGKEMFTCAEVCGVCFRLPYGLALSELFPVREEPVLISSVLMSLMVSLMSPLLIELLSSKL